MTILAFLPLIGEVLDRIIPDPKAAADAKMKLLEMEQTDEFKALDTQVALATAQTNVNAIEAANPNWWTSGWRPGLGWVCFAGCAWNWVGLPVCLFLCDLLNHPMALAPADLSQMLPMVLGMLGLATNRTYEKVKGVA